MLATALSFSFCVIAYPLYIKCLTNKQIGQFIREEGPASHAKKAKTPTMGGLCFIVGTVIATIAVTLSSSRSLISLSGGTTSQQVLAAFFVLAAAVCCGLLGFADDYGKVTSKSNKGISGKFRLACEFSLGLLLALGFYLVLPGNQSPQIVLNAHAFGSAQLFDLGHKGWEFLDPLFRLMMVPLLMASASNALNLHDGMDGLAGGTSLLVFITMSIMLAVIPGAQALSWVAAAAAGAILAFLLFNKYPAKIFMGDTGSLFIGALMAGLVAYGGLLLWFIPLALIYIVETLSVICQVAYFKLTKAYTPEKPMSALTLAIYKLQNKLPGEGKRLLRMAPMHHHFEALAAEKGHREWQVVVCFWIVQFLLCALCLLGFAI